MNFKICCGRENEPGGGTSINQLTTVNRKVPPNGYANFPVAHHRESLQTPAHGSLYHWTLQFKD